MKKWTRARFQPNLPLGEDARKVTASPSHLALARRACREGVVLLKNDKIFKIEKKYFTKEKK